MLLGVNIDHVATLRQARGTRYPDPVAAAYLAEQAGADLITVHLREDRRHIQERDIVLLQETLLTAMNLEMALTETMLAIAEKIKPKFCCIVPEQRAELSTEGGFDVKAQMVAVKQACLRLHEAGVRVSLFVDPDEAQIQAAYDSGVSCIELHTGAYANATDAKSIKQALNQIIQSVVQAKALGLCVNAGHGLNYQNVKAIASISGISELNIGHSIIARAVLSGLPEAVQKMRRLIDEAALPD